MERDGQLDLYEALAARLKEAHAIVRGLELPAAERAALTRRLLAITAVSKHDLATAARRLEGMLGELETLRHKGD